MTELDESGRFRVGEPSGFVRIKQTKQFSSGSSGMYCRVLKSMALSL
jgi:hypothetical protein